MEMTGSLATLIWLAVIGACIGVYYLYKQGKIPWLKSMKGKGVKMPKMFEPKAETRTERLKAQTEREIARAEGLRSMLAAKKELARARAENIRLMREIDGVNEKSVEKEKLDEQKAQEAEIEAKKVKPKRL